MADSSSSNGNDPIIIAVMGVTGTGKSSFINVLTGQKTGIGKNLQSETEDVVPYTMKVQGREVILLDTPGFDDTYKCDTETLRTILAWLKLSGLKSTLLSGLIYMHRITDDRVTGTMAMNLNVVKELCGEQAAKNIMLTSARWEEASSKNEQTRFEAKENQLKTNYWKVMIVKGAKIARYNRTRKSALDIVNRIINDNTPIKIQAQIELERPGATIGSTTAAGVVKGNSKATAGKWESEIQNMKIILESMVQQSLKQGEYQKKLHRMQARYQKEQQNLTEYWKSNNRALEDKVNLLEKKLDGKRCVIM